MKPPIIAVFAGGTSPEREVALGSGKAVAIAAARSFPTQFFDITTNSIPSGLDPRQHVVLSTLHGTFGEDGGMQALLDRAGVEYAGCDAAISALAMDKARTKAAVAGGGRQMADGGMRIIDGIELSGSKLPDAERVVGALGEKVVLKPNDQGSSVGLQLLEGRAAIASALRHLPSGNWLLERRIEGRELTVGILRGRAMGVVEIRPKSGVFDYTSKYTKGLTEYLAPAPLEPRVTAAVQAAAEMAFAACGCRDYARVDFILGDDGGLYFLEINTLPGMKETSLLPMSARCAGLDFTALVREMVGPALERFQSVPEDAIP